MNQSPVFMQLTKTHVYYDGPQLVSLTDSDGVEWIGVATLEDPTRPDAWRYLLVPDRPENPISDLFESRIDLLGYLLRAASGDRRIAYDVPSGIETYEVDMFHPELLPEPDAYFFKD
jgi:hypothetical protein